jgi:endoglucanase
MTFELAGSGDWQRRWLAMSEHSRPIRAFIFLIASLALLALGASSGAAYYSGALTPGDPLAGHPWFIDRARGAWFVTLREHPGEAARLRFAANNPTSKTLGGFTAHPQFDVRDYIKRAHAEQPGAVPFINVARIETQSCPYPFYGPYYSEWAVDNWMLRLSHGIGSSRIAVMIETDRLTTIGCLPGWAQNRRYRELSYEVHVLHQNNPNAIVYIDAGSQDWGKNAQTIALRLQRADVAEAQGFLLGASHHNWTSREDRFGMQISRLLGGKHFVVNTSENGWGPRPHAPTPWAAFYHQGCTPPGEGLGIRPTVRTRDRHIDAYVWAGTPGFESGDCLGLGANAPYAFYLQEALSLVRFANPGLR